MTRRNSSCSARDTVQVCTGVMKFGYECVKPMCEELLAFMEKHKFETLADFKGKSLDYFTTHADLVQTPGRAQGRAKSRRGEPKKMVKADGEWSGDDFVKQSDALARAKLRSNPQSAATRTGLRRTMLYRRPLGYPLSNMAQ